MSRKPCRPFARLALWLLGQLIYGPWHLNRLSLGQECGGSAPAPFYLILACITPQFSEEDRSCCRPRTGCCIEFGQARAMKNEGLFTADVPRQTPHTGNWEPATWNPGTPSTVALIITACISPGGHNNVLFFFSFHPIEMDAQRVCWAEVYFIFHCVGSGYSVIQRFSWEISPFEPGFKTPLHKRNINFLLLVGKTSSRTGKWDYP